MGTEKRLSLKSAALMCAQTFTVKYEDGSEEIYVRTPTHMELADAEERLAESRLEIRKRYAPGTVHYQSLIASLELENERSLAERIVLQEIPEIQRRAMRGLSTPMTPDWSRFATEKEKEKAEAKHEEDKAEHLRQWQAKTEQLIDTRETELAAQPKDKLLEDAVRPTLQMIIEQETDTMRQAHIVYLSVREAEEPHVPYFESVDEVTALPQKIRQYLSTVIEEVQLVRPIDIKNSLGRSVLLSGSAENTQEVTEVPLTNGSSDSPSPKPRRRGGHKASSNG